VTVAALVVLAGRLPGHTEPGGDLRPSDAHADRLIRQHREFGLCLLPGESGSFDPLQQLGRRQRGIRCGGPGRSARPWGRRMGCTSLILGWRLDLLT
jgi:hypothetical protein